ncbi:MAG: hypothetical protein V8T10_01545 [Merdibacter sp.]
MRVSGTWKQLHSDHNFGQFSFDDYMAKRGVRYRISSEESETLSQGNTLRARLFRHAGRVRGKAGIGLLTHLWIQEEGSYLLSACGLHLSSLAHWLKKLSGKRLPSGRARRPRSSFWAWRWLPDQLQRFLVPRALHTDGRSAASGSKRDAAGLSILLVLLFRPYMVSELSFVLPTGLSSGGLLFLVRACVRVRSPCWSSSCSSYVLP